MHQTTIGLSGHIDHGKTSIVKSLTGKNTDNLKDEIKRGMTIDIGFAHLNNKISLIDVPGHEKFIKNMVAGVSSIDSVILVVAADDGIMPQTKEHFQILKLLGLSSGIIVINKIDLVDEEWLSLVELEIKDLVKDTFLDSAKIIKVSTILNKGIDLLKEEIINISTLPNSKFNRNIFRMFIDRVFTKKGFGTVVTGTISSGKINKNKQVQILPKYEKATIRGLHSHDNISDELFIGNRAAINLQSVDRLNLKRGYHIGELDYFSMVSSFIANITFFEDLKHNQRVRVHLGTQEVMGRVLFSDTTITSKTTILLRLEKKIIAAFKDRFIIRNYSPITTIGGGEILDINISGKWNKNKKYMETLQKSETIPNVIERIIERDTNMVFTKSKLSQHLSLSIDVLDDYLKEIKNLDILGEKDPWLITLWQSDYYLSSIDMILSDLHKKSPYLNGFLIEEINNKISLPEILLKKILNSLCSNNKIKVLNDLYSIYDFSIELSNNDILIIKNFIKILDSELFQTSSIEELSLILKIDINKVKKLLHIEKNNNNIIIINGEIIFSRKNYNSLLEKLDNYFKKNNILNIKEFKDMINSTRKYAVPLLEYLDKQKITFRFENGRKYNKK